MRKLMLLVVLVIVLCANTARADWWAIAVGQLDVLISQSSYDKTYNSFYLQVGGPSASNWAALVARGEAEQRVSNALAELCALDRNACADIFARYGLRWRPAPDVAAVSSENAN